MKIFYIKQRALKVKYKLVYYECFILYERPFTIPQLNSFAVNDDRPRVELRRR